MLSENEVLFYPRVIPRRAMSVEDKQEVLLRLLAAWEACPHQRLGQLIMNTMRTTLLGRSMFQIEDFDLIAGIEKFAVQGKEG